MRNLAAIIFLFFINQHFYSQSVYWEKILDESYIYDMKTTSNGFLYACPQSLHGILISSDGGNSWVPNISLDVPINNISIDANDNIYLSSRNGRDLFKSSDYGDSWTVICSLAYDVTSLHVSKKGCIYAGRKYGGFLRSLDSGKTWIASSISDREIISIATSSDEMIFVCTQYGPMLTSADSGETWTQLEDPPNTFSAEDVILDENDYLYTARDSKIGISTDFGLTWQITGNFPYYTTTSILGKDSNNIYFGYNSLYKSTDGGYNWNNIGGPKSITSIISYEDKIYLSSYSGIYRYDPLVPIYVGSNYFPMHLKNKWQFLRSSYHYQTQEYTLWFYGIEKDSTINGVKYYNYSGKWLRYSEQDKKIYIWYNDSNRIYMDFNLPAMTTFPHYIGNFDLDYSTVFDGTKTIFGSESNYKGFSAGSNYGLYGNSQESFAENLGPIVYSYSMLAGPDYSYTENLIMAIIYDSLDNPHYYSNHYKPQIILNPITMVDSSNFMLGVSVDHNYSRFFDPASPRTGLNFVDSVYMISHYTNGDSTIFNDTIQANNIAKTKDYTIYLILDSALMKNGYSFNYKISAKDKGIIPEYVSLPETGFYQCSWGPATSITDKKNLPKSFQLSQNYPNPFNPTTKIGFRIAEFGFVSLKIYDVLGNEVAELVNEAKSPGEYEVEFDGSSLSSSVYFYQLRAGNFISAKKLILLE